MRPIEEFIKQAKSSTTCWDGNNTFYDVRLKGDNVTKDTLGPTKVCFTL